MSSAIPDLRSHRQLAAPREHEVVLVVADAPRELVGALLATMSALTVRSIEDLVGTRPDVVVLATDSATSAGMAALRRLRKELATSRLIVVARDDRTAIAARQALNEGADAFIRGEEVERALSPAVGAVMAGLICAPRIARRLVAKPTFSHREKQVLELLTLGLTNRQIATRLYLAESTVKTHLVSAFAKLGVRSRKDAVALLLDPAEDLAATALPQPTTLT